MAKFSKTAKIDRELEKSVILLLQEAFPRNNPAKAKAVVEGTPRDGTPAQPTGPSFGEKVRALEVAGKLRQIMARIADDDDNPGDGTSLADLQRQLRDKAGGSAAAPAKSNGAGR